MYVFACSGMSYTDFKYSDMHVTYNKEKDVFEISVKVTNTGDHDMHILRYFQTS